jgi:hypothetical protein
MHHFRSHMLTCIAMFALAALAQSPASAEEIVGKVFNTDGSPAKQAEVYLIVRISADSKAEPSLTKTDDAGAFRFERPASVEYATAVAVGADGAMMFDDWSPQHSPSIHLRAGTNLSVPFVGPDGKPAADVVVAIHGLNLQDGDSFPPPVVSLPALARPPFGGKTDASGVLELRGLPQESAVMLNVEDDRYAQLTWENRIQVPKKAQMRAARIQLAPGANLSGKVTFDPGAKPAVGLRIAAQSLPGAGGGWGSAVTDADGVYHIHGLSAGAYNVAADIRDDWAKAWTARAVAGVEVATGETKNRVDLTLIAGGVITGQVVGPAGEPLDNVWIGVYGPAHPETSGWVQTDRSKADGSFSFRVPAGDQHVYASQPPKGYGLPADPNHNITVEDGKTANVEFRLVKVAPPATIKVKVVGPDGNPVADAVVSVFSSRSNFPGGKTVISSADGTFEADAPEAGATAILRARKDDMATRSSTTLKRANPGEVTLKIEPNVLASISGRAVDENGSPLPNVEVQLIEMTGSMGFGRSTGPTDDDGRFHIAQLFPDGNYSVWLQAKGYGVAKSQNQLLSLRPGEDHALPDMVLRKRNAHIAGLLLDDDGNPLKGARLQVTGTSTGSNPLTTDKDGKFGEDVVAGDALHIYLELKDGRWIDKPVNAGEEHIVLDPMTDAKGPR